MKSFSPLLRAAALALTLITLLLALPSCGNTVLYETTEGDLTFTLYGTGSGDKSKVERIVVTRDGKKVGTYDQVGLRRELAGDDYGFSTVDLNFDGILDMRLKTAKKTAGMQFACYLWDAEKGYYVYHPSLSALQNLTVADTISAITACEYEYTVDPATGDTPEFYTERNAFVIYRWIDGKLNEVHRKELTYYEESDIYCYAVFDLDEDGEMDTTRESWITADRFDADRYPLDATGYAAG